MHPLIPAFEPPAFSLGPVTIHGFGILVALGFWFATNMTASKAVRFTGDPSATARVNRLATWIILGTLFGGHWGHILFYEPSMLQDDPLILLQFWKGLSSFGGFIACAILTVIFFYRERQPFYPYADALSIGISIGWFFGRMGCFSAHDHPGGETDFWLGVYGMCPGNNPKVACHDLGLYEALWSGVMFLVFQALDRKPRFHGFYLGLLCTTYGVYRFVSDFYRHPGGIDVRYAGLTPAQYGSALVLLIGIWVLVTRSRTAKKA